MDGWMDGRTVRDGLWVTPYCMVCMAPSWSTQVSVAGSGAVVWLTGLADSLVSVCAPSFGPLLELSVGVSSIVSSSWPPV